MVYGDWSFIAWRRPRCIPSHSTDTYIATFHPLSTTGIPAFRVLRYFGNFSTLRSSIDYLLSSWSQWASPVIKFLGAATAAAVRPHIDVWRPLQCLSVRILGTMSRPLVGGHQHGISSHSVYLPLPSTATLYWQWHYVRNFVLYFCATALLESHSRFLNIHRRLFDYTHTHSIFDLCMTICLMRSGQRSYT